MSAKIKELKEDIDTLKELLAGDLTADERKDFQDELDALEVKLAEEEGKGAEKEVVKEEKKEPKPAKEKAKKEPKAPKEPKAKPAKKEKPAKAPKPAKAKPAKGETIIIVNKKEYDLNDCKQAIRALKERKIQGKQLGKKYKTKKPASKVAGNVETMIHQIEGAVSGKKVDDNPKLAIATFREFKTKLNQAFNVLNKIMSKEDVNTIKKSLLEIDDIIAKYKD
jgi:outer membrane biosynthesis protein TonB